jgi:small subunit ribosomal protein S16
VSVRIRMKKMGRSHRPFYRVCAIDKHTPRDGRVLEELGTYDTNVADTDARAVLKTDRIDYWLSVGAQPSDKVAVLIKKYGTNGTHKSQQEVALEKLALPKVVPAAGVPVSLPKKEEEEKPEEAKAEAAAPATETAEAPAAEAPAAEAPAPEEKAEKSPKEQADAPSE